MPSASLLCSMLLGDACSPTPQRVLIDLIHVSALWFLGLFEYAAYQVLILSRSTLEEHQGRHAQRGSSGSSSTLSVRRWLHG